MRVSIQEEKPPTSSHAQRKVAFFGYGAAVFFFWASLYVYVPTLPLYIQAKTNTLAYVGTVLSMYGLWQAILRLPLGVAADLLGKRKLFILLCFAFSAVGALWMSAASDVQGLILGRGITGLAAAGWVPLTVVFSSLFLPQEAVRASAILSFINAISRMSATSVTWLINDWSGDYNAAFYAAAGLALVGLIIVIPLQEKFDSAVQITRESPAKGKDLLGVMIRLNVIIPSLLGALNQYAIFASSFGFFPILAKQFGANNLVQSVISSVCLLMIMLGALATSRLVHRINATRLTFISFTLLGMGLLLGALAKGLEMLMMAQLLTGLGSGIGYSVLMGLSIQRVDESERNTAMGVFQSLYGLGMFGGPWVSGILADMMGIEPMLIITSLAIVCFGIGGTIICSACLCSKGKNCLAR
jgi:MFS family permease